MGRLEGKVAIVTGAARGHAEGSRTEIRKRGRSSLHL